MVKKLELKEIVLIGRSFEEYNSFFELAEIDKDNRILDVALGVSSLLQRRISKDTMLQLWI